MQFELGQLQALRAAVDTGSLDAAARQLHVTPSAISQRLKTLEATVGRRLLVRARPVEATEDGERVLRLARQIDLLQADVERELTNAPGAEPIRLSIAANADSLDTWLLPALAAAGGKLVLDVHREDEGRTAALLHAGTVVAAVTAAAGVVAGCSTTPLGTMRYRPAATPDYVAHWFANGLTADALSVAPVVHFDRNDNLQRGWLRDRLDKRPMPPGHQIPTTGAFELAVRSGLGWGMLSEYQLASDRTPDIVTLDDSAAEVALFWQRWKLATPALDHLTRLVTHAAQLALDPPNTS